MPSSGRRLKYIPSLKGRHTDLDKRATMNKNRFGIPVRTEDVSDGTIRCSVKQSKQKFEVQFISKNIKMRQCTAFVADKESGRFCKCGNLKLNHTEQAKANARDEDDWLPERDTTSVPTDNFGEMEFHSSGDKTAKFVRACTKTSEENIMGLLTEAWGLEMPNLVISVAGGTESFDTKSRLCDAFRHGLIKAASSTGAWIVTGGTYSGITKVVGEAVHDYYLTSLERVVAIGIAPWGCVQNRDVLVRHESCSPVSYQVRGRANEKLTFLDPNHSHFLLADDGTHHKFGSHVSFRSKVLKTISKAKVASEMDPHFDINVPVCLLVLNGGKGTLQNVREAVKNGIPTVIVKGSGKMADILAFAYESLQNNAEKADGRGGEDGNQRRSTHEPPLAFTRLHPDVLSEITRMVRDIMRVSDVTKYVQWITECMACEDVISVFHFSTKTSAVDIDLAILRAFIKVNKSLLSNQLKLALVWNRIDIAESIIQASTDNLWRGAYLRQLDDAMQLAILLGNAPFITLLMDSGVELQDFLTVFRLQDLYNCIPKACLLYKLLSKERKVEREFTLVDVGRVIKRLVSVLHNHEYLTDSMYAAMDNVNETTEQFEMNSFSRDYNDDTSFSLHRQAQHLFTWAILMNKTELSKVFWKESKESLAMTLFGISILKALMSYTNDKDELEEMQSGVDEYRDLALGVLRACYTSDPSRTFVLMTRCVPQWGSTNCIILAFHADEKMFLADRACQSLLDHVWQGDIEETNIIKILVCAFLPPLVCFIRFRFRPKRTPFISRPQTTSTEGSASTKQRRRNQRYTSCGCPTLYQFYNAPVVTFSLHVLFYSTFLLMYSYLLVSEMGSEFHMLEAVLIAWVGTILAEEIRQLMITHGSTFLDKIRKYLFDTWNSLDVITIGLFTAGMVLRHGFPSRAEESRIVLSLNLITFFLRLLHIFSINSTLGPMLVMISSMVKDLMWFGIITLIFIISYGIASESVLCPNSSLDWNLLYYIPRRAYWQVYGDLFLEDIEGDANMTCPNVVRETNCSQGFCASSQKGKYYVIVLLGIYVLLTNVLLMNLVIAMFSNTFNKIQESSHLHWCYQRLRLIYEYSERPLLPPPFTVLAHIRLLCLACYRKLKKINPDHSHFWTRLPANEGRNLVQWESVITDNYIRYMEKTQAESSEKRQAVIDDRLETILCKMDEMQLTINHLTKKTKERESSRERSIASQPPPEYNRTNTIMYSK